MSFVASTSSASQIARRVSLRVYKRAGFSTHRTLLGLSSLMLREDSMWLCNGALGQLDSLWLDYTINEATLCCCNRGCESCFVALRVLRKLIWCLPLKNVSKACALQCSP